METRREARENMKKKFFSSYESDASRARGVALDVVHPKTVEDVKKIVLENEKILIRGSGSGLVGGAVPQEEVVLDLSKLVKIHNLDEKKRTVEVEAGVVLDDLQDYLRSYNLEFPINPASHAVVSVGGMIATNAGGSRSLKYGRVSNWVKWVEVIDSRGKIEKKGVTELSDYVGMEGITGVIVRACLVLHPLIERSASLIRSDNLEELTDIIHKLKQKREVSSLEFFGRMISEKLGLGEGYHLIVEYENEDGELRGEKYKEVMGFVEEAYSFAFAEKYIIEDIKIMLNKFPKLMQWAEENEIPVFGHIGTGILHPCFKMEQETFIPKMIKLVRRLGGQISGEYGIGILKRGFVEITDQKIWQNVKKRTDLSRKFNFNKMI